MYRVEQYVMEYEADGQAIQRLLPEGYVSLRPIFRIKSEVITDQAEIEGEQILIAFSTPVVGDDTEGWFDLAVWDNRWTDITGIRDGRTTRFTADFDGTEFLDIRYTMTGDGNFQDLTGMLNTKTACACTFAWRDPGLDYFAENPKLVRQAMGVKSGKILAAYVLLFDREE